MLRSSHWPVIVLLTWGVFALGASRPWGYIPLLTGMAVYGAGILWNSRGGAIGRGLCFSWVALCATVAFQLVPLPTHLADRLSPTLNIVHAGTSASRPLSVDPAATTVGLIFVVALGLFFIATVKSVEQSGARQMVTGLVVLGAVVALVGIAESVTGWRVSYGAGGLPLPPDSTPHGPFSNRNHYAGWMLMMFALTIGYLCAGEKLPHRGWPRPMALVYCVVTMMAIAIVQTRSRAGIVGLGIATVTMAGGLLHRGVSGRQRLYRAGSVLVMLLAVIAVTGVRPVFHRFAVDSWSNAHGRLPIWRQAGAIAMDFPVTGSGLNTYRAIVPYYPTPDIDEPYEGAHSDFLQLAVEGGLLILCPVSAIVWLFIRDVRRRFREPSQDSTTFWLRAGAVLGLSLVALQETVDFTLQIPGNAALFVVLAAIAVHRSPSRPHESDCRPF